MENCRRTKYAGHPTVIPAQYPLMIFSARHALKMSLVFVVVMVLHFTSHAQTSSAEEKILLDIEKLRCEAIASHNGTYLNTVYHDQFRGVTANGMAVDKKGMIEVLKSVPVGIQFTTDEMKASIYGYAGVASGKLISKDKSGTIVDQSRFMNVYIKRNGQWKIIEGQGTAINP